jgi:hypothetical protein
MAAQPPARAVSSENRVRRCGGSSVATNTTFLDGVIVCLPYADVDDDGFVDATTPPINETQLKILHNEVGVFVDRTSSRSVLWVTPRSGLRTLRAAGPAAD